MKTRLSTQDVFNLSKSFHDLSSALGEFRYSNWDSLTPAQRNDLESKQWTLFNTSSDLNAKSVVLKVKLLDDEIQKIKNCISDMQATAKKITDVKHAVAIAAKAVAFGGTIYLAASTGNAAVMIAAATSLIQELNT
ncbi:hypothetical protein KKE54_07340 [bacterium]|jgi:virulence-associated protein VapD|nr:hypothetical protein [bacterium]